MHERMVSTDTFLAYADGSCLGNPGPGGWAYYLFRDGKETTASGGSAASTNNIMELTAAIRVLTLLDPLDSGAVCCDSLYVIRGLTEWRKGWIERGWRTAKNKPVANGDLWKELSDLFDAHPHVRFEWVKAHDSDVLNNRVDEMARLAAGTMR